jgi:hypothetical protein
MPSFEINKGYKKPANKGPSLPQTGETKRLPKGHNYRPGSIDVKLAGYRMKKGFGGMA